MKYLVMECGLGYAIVLDSDGRFLKVPNLGYEVGQTLEQVILFPEEEAEKPRKSFFQRNISRLTAVAACFCLLVVGSHQFLFRTYGTVRMQINPDVLLSVNRLNYVTDIDGLNDDGEDLIDDYRSFGKKVDVVSDELSALAMEKGYLDENGKISLTVHSKHENWKRTMEEKLVATISLHLPESIHVEVQTAPMQDIPVSAPKTEPVPEMTVTIPVYPEGSDYGNSHYEEGTSGYHTSNYGNNGDSNYNTSNYGNDGDSNYNASNYGNDGDSNYNASNYGNDSDSGYDQQISGSSDYNEGSNYDDSGYDNDDD